MNHRIIAGLLAVCVSTPGLSQDQKDTDLSRYEVLDEGETLKTLKQLQEMEDAYKALVAAGNCDDALPRIIAFHEAANKTGNIIRRGNEPYYDARRDDQKAVAGNRDLLNLLVSAENTSNNLVHQRNRAWVEEAKCLLEQGDTQGAIHRLYRALDYIGTTHKERALWEEARSLLWNEVGFTPKQ